MKLSLPGNLFNHLPKAYLVGGSVRDLLRGAEPEDYDIAVAHPPDRFARTMANRLNGKIVKLGKDRFSLYRIVSGALAVDITGIKDNDIHKDLKERDFTINAIACDLSTREIIDTVGGLADLRRRSIKMVSPDAFIADPVRLIRAYRMAATLDFDIEAQTVRTIAQQAAAIKETAAERIWAELRMIMACPDTVSALRDMAGTTLLFHIIPELSDLKGCHQNNYHTMDVFDHTINAYQAMESILHRPDRYLPSTITKFITAISIEKQVRSKMAVLLHDTGKPASRTHDEQGRIHFYGHAAKSAELSRKICRRLHMSNRQQKWIEAVVRYHGRPLWLYLAQQRHPLRPKTVGRFFRQCGQATPYVLIHAMADAKGKQEPPANRNEAMHNFYQDLLRTYLERTSLTSQPPIIDGNDIMEIFKIPPSPLLGKILRNVQELQMAGSLTEREQTLRWVSDYLDARK